MSRKQAVDLYMKGKDVVSIQEIENFLFWLGLQPKIIESNIKKYKGE